MRLQLLFPLAVSAVLIGPADVAGQGRVGRAGMSSIGNAGFGGGFRTGAGDRGGVVAGRAPANGAPALGRSGPVSTGFRGTDRVVVNPPSSTQPRGRPPEGSTSRNHVKEPRVRPWHYNGYARHGRRGSGFGGQYYTRYNPYVYYGYGLPYVYVPYGYARYRNYYEDFDESDADDDSGDKDTKDRKPRNVYQVEPGQADSSSGYIVRVPERGQEPVQGTVFEVRPEGLRPASGDAARIPPAAAPDGIPFHLIALRDGTIYTSREHWLEKDALHYVTRDGVHNRVSFGEVDMDLTAQVNRERGMPFLLEVREPTP